MNILNFLRQVLSDSKTKKPSSKRFIGFLAFIVLSILSFHIVFTKRVIPNQNLTDTIIYIMFGIIATGVLGITADKWMGKKVGMGGGDQPETTFEEEDAKTKKKANQEQQQPDQPK